MNEKYIADLFTNIFATRLDRCCRIVHYYGISFYFADVNQCYRNRMVLGIVKFLDTLNNTPEYRYQKKNMLIAMKQHGDGLHHLEEKSLFYIQELLDKFETHSGTPFEPTNLIKTTIGQLMMTLTYGFSSDEAVQTIFELEEKFFSLFVESGPVLLLNFCPLFRFVLPSVQKVDNDIHEVMNAYRELFIEFTERRKEQFDEKDPKIFIDHFLNLVGKSVRIGPGNNCVKLTSRFQ